MPYLFLLFVAVPIIEIALFIQVGGVVGLFPTLLIVIGTAALGTWMLRQQGMKTMETARARLDAGQLPAHEIVEGVLLLVGGVLLLTPGFMTDAFGFACLLPASRGWLARRIGERVRVGAISAGVGPGPSGPPTPGASAPANGTARTGSEVIDGDYERLD